MDSPHYVILDTHDIVGVLYQEIQLIGAHSFNPDELVAHTLNQLSYYFHDEQHALSLLEEFIDQLIGIIDDDSVSAEAMHGLVWGIRRFGQELYRRLREVGLYYCPLNSGNGKLAFDFCELIENNIILKRSE